MSTLRRLLVVVLALVALAPGLAGQTPGRHPGRHSEGRVREVHAAQRPAGDPARRPQAADRPREPVVPRRVEEREDRPHRLRAPVRAHDVPGLEERQRRVLRLRREGRRQPARGRRQRHDQQRPHQLLRDGAVGATSRTCCGSNRTAWRRCSTRPTQGKARRAARRRQERAPAGPREPALRPLVHVALRERSIRRATRIRGRSSAAWKTSPPRRWTT